MVDETTGAAYANDLAIHIIELPKFTAAVEQLRSGLDAWLYFLRHAAQLDSDALPAALDVPPIRKAMQELVMVTQSELERERYEARLKAQLDENSWRRALENAAS